MLLFVLCIYKPIRVRLVQLSEGSFCDREEGGELRAGAAESRPDQPRGGRARREGARRAGEGRAPPRRGATSNSAIP
jgi:hypothetical protein